MKSGIRTMGFDDGDFAFQDATAPVAGVVMRGASYVEGVVSGQVTVDGADATTVLRGILQRSRFTEQLHAVLLDGIALGGFNVVDPRVLHRSLDVPVLTVTRGTPEREGIRAALREHVDAWEPRWEVLDACWPEPIETRDGTVSVHAEGMSHDDVAALLERTTARGLLPEPLRVAHLVASAWARGESARGA